MSASALQFSCGEEICICGHPLSEHYLDGEESDFVPRAATYCMTERCECNHFEQEPTQGIPPEGVPIQ